MQVLWNSDLYGKYPIERFAITVIGKTILRSGVLVTEKLSTKWNKPKLK